MIRNPLVIAGMVIAALAGAWLYFEFRTPPGVEPMGENTELIAWLGLGTSVVGFLTALVGLVQTVIQKR